MAVIANALILLYIVNFKYPSPTEFGYPAGKNVSQNPFDTLDLSPLMDTGSCLVMLVIIPVFLSISRVAGDVSFSKG